MTNHAEISKPISFLLTLLKTLAIITGVFCSSALAVYFLMPKFPGAIEKGKTTKTASNIRAISTAIALNKEDVGKLPSVEEGLAALLENPVISGWGGPYFRQEEIPEDGWGRPFRYRVNNGTYVITSAGSDGIMDTDDDMSSDQLADR